MRSASLASELTPAQRALLLKAGAELDGLEPVSGDASARRFLRAPLGSDSCVLMIDPDASSLDRYAGIARFFRAQGLPVPEILAVDRTASALLMQDLGRVMLRERLTLGSAAEREQWLRAAFELCARIQAATSRLTPDCPAYHVSFDAATFKRELAFFHDHYLAGLSGLGPLEPELVAAFDLLASKLAAQERVLVHRDFHIDNLVVSSGRLALVDFQDARWGPASYDPASLLGDRDVDAFLPLPRADLIKGFADLTGRDPVCFELALREALLQRGLKAIGTFAYQTLRHGRRAYLRFVQPTIERLQGFFPEEPRLASIAVMLEGMAERRSHETHLTVAENGC